MENDPAISKFLEILEKNPADVEAFNSLEEYYLLSNEWEPLTVIYEVRAQEIEKSSPTESAQLYYKQAECLEKRLAKGNEALKAYEKAYSLNPEQIQHFESLIALGESLQDWEKVLTILQHKLNRTKERTEQAKLLLQMADYLFDQLDDREQAKELLVKAAEIDESNEQPLLKLEKIYLQEKSWESLLDLYQIKYQRADNNKDKIKNLRRCAQVCEENLQYLPKAIEFYREIVQISPADIQALSSLESLFTSTEQWEQVVPTMEQQLKLLKTDEEKIKLLTSIALIWSEKLNDLDEAIACYERALKIEDDEMVLGILEETYRFQENWPKLADIYQRQSKLVTSPEEKNKIYCLLGELYEEKIKQLPQAIKWYQAAFEESPNELFILKNLQHLYQQQGDIENLLLCHRKELDFPLEKSEKLTIYKKMAKLLLENEYLEVAAEVYEEIFSLYP